MIKVVGVGDNVIDRYMHMGMMYPGGNSVNFAVLAKRMGHEAAYMGVIADDRYARVVTDALAAEGVDDSQCAYVHGETGLSTTTIDENGDRTITDNNEYGAVKATPLQLTDERLAFIAGFDIAHSSCFSFIEDQLHRIKSLGVPLVYDFSDLWQEADFDAICPNIDVAFFSGKKLPREALEALLAKAIGLGCTLAISTVGKQGALIYNGRKVYSGMPYNLDAEVVDTLGAGDSFLTGFLTTYVEGLKTWKAAEGDRVATRQDWHRFEDGLIEYGIQAGNLMAIKCCMEYGAFSHGVAL